MLKFLAGIFLGVFVTGWYWSTDPSALSAVGIGPTSIPINLGMTTFDVDTSNTGSKTQAEFSIRPNDAPPSVVVLNKQFVTDKSLWGSVGLFWGYGERNMTACREFVEFARQALKDYPDPATFDCDIVQPK